MPRIACLHIPGFQIIVQQNTEQLKGKPLALINGKLSANGYSRARIFMCSKEAQEHEIKNNMRLAEAKAQCADLVLREQDYDLYKIAQYHLASKLIAYSPKVKTEALGIILLDASGLSLQGGESHFCHNILKLCSKLGYTDSYIGITDSAFAAIVASKLNSRRINIVPAKSDATFLAPLSIEYLNLAPEVENTLLTLGITTLGQLAKIPVDELNKRFGQFSEIIWQPWLLAQGIDNRLPTIPQIEKTYECSLDFGGAVSQFGEITFALKSMISRLIAALKENSLSAQEIILSFYNDTTKFEERTIPLIQPTNNEKFLLEIIRLSLNTKPLARELTSLMLQISRQAKQDWQQKSIDENNHRTNNGALSQRESSLLQRFSIRIGKQAIFKAEASNQYLNTNAGVWIPINTNTNEAIKESLLPLDKKYLQEKNYLSRDLDLVLRTMAKNKEVLVQLNEAKPSAINYDKKWYKIHTITIPEYLSSQWWSRAITKDYYKIVVEPIAKGNIIQTTENNGLFLMLLSHDKQKNTWSIEGIYD